MHASSIVINLLINYFDQPVSPSAVSQSVSQ